MITILVTSCGDAAATNFLRSLEIANPGHYRIIGVDSSPMLIAHSLATERWVLPDASEQPELFLAQLKELVRRTRPDLIYAADTSAELLVISEHRESLGARTFMPRHEDVMVLEDKWLTYERLAGRPGIRLPDTVLVNAREDLERIFARHSNVWLRNRCGSGAKGAIATDNIDFAHLWIERHQGWGRFTAAQCLTRRSSTWSGVWHEGEVVACQARDRIFWAYGATSPTGITGITGAQVTSNREDLHRMATAAVRSVVSHPEGIIGVDFTYDADGLPHITEIQASRFYTSIHFLAKAGLNMPSMFVDLALGRDVPRHASHINGLPEGLLWLKQVECEPIFTTVDGLSDYYSVIAEGATP